VARRNVVDSKAVAPAMLGAATFPRTVLLLLPRETLRLALKIDHLKIAQLRIALPKAVRKKAGPKRHVPKKAAPKRVALKKIVVLSAIGPTTPKFLTSITMTLGSATIPVAETNITMWIVRGSMAASPAATGAAMNIGLAEETAIDSGSTIFTSVSRRMTTITSTIGTGTTIPS
jgi:hypothetical protein